MQMQLETKHSTSWVWCSFLSQFLFYPKWLTYSYSDPLVRFDVGLASTVGMVGCSMLKFPHHGAVLPNWTVA